MPKYILSADAGTTEVCSALFNAEGRICAKRGANVPPKYPNPGWAEQDAEEIFRAVKETVEELFDYGGMDVSDVHSMGITNQRETVVVWDSETGKPVCDAILWQCRRTSETCEKLKDFSEIIKRKTGLIPDAYFSATKIKWILDNVPGAKESADKGKLLFGTVDSWLIWKLTGGKVHATDVSNASRTMLMNLETCRWDSELSEMFGIPENMLPEIHSSVSSFGSTEESLFGRKIPITGVMGDQQASLFGHGCFGKGDAKCTYGTGGFLLMNTGKDPVFSDGGLITTVAWDIGDGTVYAAEGSVYSAGAAVKWLCDGIGLLNDPKESEEAAESVEDTGGCYMVPAFTGLGSPYWNQDARGTIVGITSGTGRNHIIRAVLESVAFGINDSAEVFARESDSKINRLLIDGTASGNDFIASMQADISNIPVIRSDCKDSSARGAAFAAGLGSGFWKNTEELKKLCGTEKTFLPGMSEDKRSEMLSGWKRAVDCSIRWAENGRGNQ